MMNRRHELTAMATILVITMILLSVQGFGQVQRMKVDDLARTADAVVVGKVTALSSEWSPDKSRIFTRVTIGVDQYLKGDSRSQSITLVTPGGEIGSVGEVYSHMATFRQDENVLVFVKKDLQGQYKVCGGSQGKYLIQKDEATKQEFVAGSMPLVQFANTVRKAILSAPR